MTGLMLMLAAAAAGGCGDRPTQTAMTMCQKAVADRADAELNVVWKRVYSAMQQRDRTAGKAVPVSEPGYAAALLASQRSWLAFRDAECRIEAYESRGGSMQPFSRTLCLSDVTHARTRQLTTMLGWAKR